MSSVNQKLTNSTSKCSVKKKMNLAKNFQRQHPTLLKSDVQSQVYFVKMKTKKEWLSSLLKKNLSLVKKLAKHGKFLAKVVLKKTVKKPWSEMVQLPHKSRTMTVKFLSNETNENASQLLLNW